MSIISVTKLLKMTDEERKELQEKAPEYQSVERTRKSLMDQRIREADAIKRAREAQKVLDGVIEEIERKMKK